LAVRVEDPLGRIITYTSDQDGVARFTIWFSDTTYDKTWHLLVPQGDATGSSADHAAHQHTGAGDRVVRVRLWRQAEMVGTGAVEFQGCWQRFICPVLRTGLQRRCFAASLRCSHGGGQ
jgi:hypothetical protein